MNPNKNKNSSSENMTRRQKLLQRGVPALLLTMGTVTGAGVVANNLLQEKGKSDPVITATTNTVAVSEFGGAEDGWEHGSAQDALKAALTRGVIAAYEKIDVNADGQADVSDDEIEQIIDQLPTYDQANDALKMAKEENSVIPDRDDEILVEVEVTADSDKHVSYEITDAKINDLPSK